MTWIIQMHDKIEHYKTKKSRCGGGSYKETVIIRNRLNTYICQTRESCVDKIDTLVRDRWKEMEQFIRTSEFCPWMDVNRVTATAIDDPRKK